MATSTDPITGSSTDPAAYPLKVYNTLSKTKEDFVPVQPGRVGIYLCGPTVYKEAHIGHLVGPVIFDTIARYLTFCGYEVTLVVNITDVDDKLIQQSVARQIPMTQVATEMTADYCANLLEVGVTQITSMPKATENIDEIIQFIEELIDKGFAYAADGDVFFDVARDDDYGKLTNRSAADQTGDGGEAAGKKRSPSDFALWKAAKENEPSWDSPWGPGRPGWHIECSAMSRRLLGKTFDIHGGGLDLTFPHHENEIAQSESCHAAPMAKYWMHNGLLRRSEASGKMGGRSERNAAPGDNQADDPAGKMSRSKGAGGLRRLLREQSGELIRFFLLRTHYRSTILYGEDELADARTALDKFYGFFERYARITGQSYYDRAPQGTIYRRGNGAASDQDSELLAEVGRLRDQYLSKMDDDFNTGGAVSELFQLLSLLNRFVDEKNLEDAQARSEDTLQEFVRACETLRELTSILGLFDRPAVATPAGGDEEQALDQVMQLLIELRAEARKNKDFAMADRIRDGLGSIGITIEDRKDGTTWKSE